MKVGFESELFLIRGPTEENAPTAESLYPVTLHYTI